MCQCKFCVCLVALRTPLSTKTRAQRLSIRRLVASVRTRMVGTTFQSGTCTGGGSRRAFRRAITAMTNWEGQTMGRRHMPSGSWLTGSATPADLQKAKPRCRPLSDTTTSITMYSIVSRNTFKRSAASVATTSRAAAVAPRHYSSTMHDNDPEVGRGHGSSNRTLADIFRGVARFSSRRSSATSARSSTRPRRPSGTHQDGTSTSRLRLRQRSRCACRHDAPQTLADT